MRIRSSEAYAMMGNLIYTLPLNDHYACTDPPRSVRAKRAVLVVIAEIFRVYCTNYISGIYMYRWENFNLILPSGLISILLSSTGESSTLFTSSGNDEPEMPQ